MARALANDPKVILADGPTGNLDIVNSERAFDLLRNLVNEREKALLLATHNPAIDEACDWDPRDERWPHHRGTRHSIS